jgi:hypothetical protein
MDIGNVIIMTNEECTRQRYSLSTNKIDTHWRFLCSSAKPYILLDAVSI